ncbi:MAG: EFR1 family ferrodoxin [Lachnospiraceae bacterium]|nr:EFR1 family ferrodoxin [Lachnospiraceae bacterium]
MLREVVLYYFSPTGGTKKAGDMFCKGFAEKVVEQDFMKNIEENVNSEVAVFAAPVFGGRIPDFVTNKMKKICGKGKKAVTLAVYGTRAYEDALLELNDTAEMCGFQVIASAAVIAQHSMVPSVGAGRPDLADQAELLSFAKAVLDKLEKQDDNKIEVPGQYPYKNHMTVVAAPFSNESCDKCGVCAEICPTGAIQITDEQVESTLEKCILCMACVSHCPTKCRMLIPAMQASINERLGALKDIRRENEFFI